MTEHTHAHHIMRATAIHNRIRNQRDALLGALQDLCSCTNAVSFPQKKVLDEARALVDRIKAEESAT